MLSEYADQYADAASEDYEKFEEEQGATFELDEEKEEMKEEAEETEEEIEEGIEDDDGEWYWDEYPVYYDDDYYEDDYWVR